MLGFLANIMQYVSAYDTLFAPPTKQKENQKYIGRLKNKIVVSLNQKQNRKSKGGSGLKSWGLCALQLKEHSPDLGPQRIKDWNAPY